MYSNQKEVLPGLIDQQSTPPLSDVGCESQCGWEEEGRGGMRSAVKPNPTQAHSLAQVNAAQSSAKGATATPYPHRGRELGAELGAPQGRVGLAKNKTQSG